MNDNLIAFFFSFARCFFFGDVCAKKDPKAHLNYICTLYDYFLINYHQFEEIDDPGKAPMLPLVVNTSGWVKGMYAYIVAGSLNKVLCIVTINRIFSS